MTLLGKVFTGLIFLLSVIFFSLAVAVNASHINQKTLAVKYQTEAKAAKDKNTELTSLLESTKDELAIEQLARRSALGALQTQLGDMKNDLQQKEKQLQDAQAALTQFTSTEKQTQAELKARTDDNELLRKQMVDAREDRNQLFQRLVGAKDQLNRLQGIYQSERERERALASQMTAAMEKLEVLDIRPETLLKAPAVNGKVTAVSTSGLVEVSLGRDDGMREGFTLEAHRDGQYLGRLKVKTVADNKSVAEIMTGYQKGYIRAGDRVDSKLF
ncbi:MAG: hypothetical protein IT422_18400 [Pirellulaceae bacterium]|nr:hypothetical protein [Pirellulaceae bacterium]